MNQKLKIITILDYAAEQKILNFNFLMRNLDISNQFELDNIIFEAFNLGLINGKVDQKNQVLKV